jgi:hypothetical protein
MYQKVLKIGILALLDKHRPDSCSFLKMGPKFLQKNDKRCKNFFSKTQAVFLCKKEHFFQNLCASQNFFIPDSDVEFFGSKIFAVLNTGRVVG